MRLRPLGTWRQCVRMLCSWLSFSLAVSFSSLACGMHWHGLFNLVGRGHIHVRKCTTLGWTFDQSCKRGVLEKGVAFLNSTRPSRCNVFGILFAQSLFFLRLDDWRRFEANAQAIKWSEDMFESVPVLNPDEDDVVVTIRSFRSKDRHSDLGSAWFAAEIEEMFIYSYRRCFRR